MSTSFCIHKLTAFEPIHLLEIAGTLLLRQPLKQGLDMPWETLGPAEVAPAFSGDVNKQRVNISTALG